MSYEQFKKLKEEVYEVISECEKSSDLVSEEISSANRDFARALELRFAKLAMFQGQFQISYEIYNKYNEKIKSVPRKLISEKFILEMLDLSGSIADATLYTEEYEWAKKLYLVTLELNKSFCNNDSKHSDAKFIVIEVGLYNKLALCEFKLNNMESVFKYIQLTLSHAEDIPQEQKGILFPVYYNYFLMYLDMYENHNIDGEKFLKKLENIKRNPVQETILLTVKAWYFGIVLGKLKIARKYADKALKMKKNLCVENDLRIAESYYVNAMLQMFEGRYLEAEKCCIKSLNILKNFTYHNFQKESSQKLLDQIRLQTDVSK